MHFEARSIESGDALRSCDQGGLEMQLEAMIERGTKYALNGQDRVNLQAGIQQV
jgi:hypothetical protein